MALKNADLYRANIYRAIQEIIPDLYIRMRLEHLSGDVDDPFWRVACDRFIMQALVRARINHIDC